MTNLTKNQLLQLKKRYLREGYKMALREAKSSSTFFSRIKRRAVKEIDTSSSLEDMADELTIIAYQEGDRDFSRAFYLFRDHFTRKLGAILQKLHKGIPMNKILQKPEEKYVKLIDFYFADKRGM